MKILSITGASSKTGKTTLIEKLIPLLTDWAVCKLTVCIPHPGGRCPRGKEDTCGVCASLEEGFRIIDDPAVIAQAGTDTGKFVLAGAALVRWVQCTPEAISEALDSVLQQFSELQSLPGVIFEGNHVLQHLEADFSVMMAGTGIAFKQSAEHIRRRVDLIVYDWNYEAAYAAVKKRFSAEITSRLDTSMDRENNE